MDIDERICGCCKTTIRDVMKLRDEGCTSVEEVVKKTNVGRACGRCKEKAELTILKVLLNRLYIK